ncbi:MAG: hypothetical protein K2L42_03255 [Clostridia bacterium]|nr:hypothetical protein [Clostridia bacterium]
MTKQDVINAAVSIVEDMSGELVPRDTGNMAFNALTINVNNDMIDIFVSPAIAPYVPYTNEPWLSERWHGKKNPNEGWWQAFAEEFAKRLATKLKGDLK